MSWGNKSKELTAEEAIAIAREELAPYWFGSDPLLIGLEQGGGYQAFPLNRDFVKKLWLILIVDPTTFLGESILDLIREWEKRYRVLSLNVLVIYSVRYQFQKNPRAAQRWIEGEATTCVRCVDVNSRLVSAFHATDLPKVLLFREGVRLFEYIGKNWIFETDFQIHKALRMADPGLPLPPVLQGLDHLTLDTQMVDLNSTTLGFPGLSLLGNWSHDEEKIWTNDEDARLNFRSFGSEVALLARPKEESDSTPTLVVELNGLPPYDAVRGSSLRVSESSDLVASLNGLNLFSILTELPTHERNVTVRFKNIKECPIEIYGLRFGEKMRVSDL